MTNRNPIKQWSITFPQSGNMGREEFAQLLPPAEKIICSQEEHKDGGYHLHLGICLKKPITKSKLLQWIQKKFPNDFKRIDIQPTRSIECWNDYISKEDADAYRYVDKSVLEKRNQKFEEQIKELQNKAPVDWKQWKRDNGALSGFEQLQQMKEDPAFIKFKQDYYDMMSNVIL